MCDQQKLAYLRGQALWYTASILPTDVGRITSKSISPGTIQLLPVSSPRKAISLAVSQDPDEALAQVALYGQDATLVARSPTHLWLCIADGVGGWMRHNVDSGRVSHGLVSVMACLLTAPSVATKPELLSKHVSNPEEPKEHKSPTASPVLTASRTSEFTAESMSQLGLDLCLPPATSRFRDLTDYEEDRPSSCQSPSVLMQHAHDLLRRRHMVEAGSTTCCLMTLCSGAHLCAAHSDELARCSIKAPINPDSQYLLASNLGDGGWVVWRNADLVSHHFLSRDGEISKQLAVIPPQFRGESFCFCDDVVDDAEIAVQEVQAGDIILLASDGLWDNLLVDAQYMVMPPGLDRLHDARVSQLLALINEAVFSIPEEMISLEARTEHICSRLVNCALVNMKRPMGKSDDVSTIVAIVPPD